MNIESQILNLLDFHQYNLSYQNIYWMTALFLFILFIAVIISIHFLGNEEKRLASSLSIVNSGAMSIVGIIYFIVKLPEYFNFLFFREPDLRPFYDMNNIAVLTCIWFALANIVHLLFGIVYYPKQLGILTAYIHHSVFIWIMWTGVTGNGLFLRCKPFASGFCLMLIEEIPTLLLALGSVFPSYRTDFGFGWTFFLLRICYHLYIFVLAVWSGVEGVAMVLYTLTLLLHLFWFYGWLTKYSGLAGKKSK